MSNPNAEQEPLSNPNAEEESLSNPNEEPLHLFKPVRIRHPEYWQCIKLIAKSSLPADMTSRKALDAYCTKCKLKIRYDAKTHSRGVSRHMSTYHQDVIDDYFEKQVGKKRSESKLTAHFAKKVKTNETASNGDQVHFRRLLAQWTARSLRPFSVTEDRGLQDVVDFATSVKGRLILSSRNTNQKYVMEEANVVSDKVLKVIEKECIYFACTTDMWSSRHRKSFMTITHHFLTENFFMKNFVLEVKEVFGSHTGELILNHMKMSFNTWNLDPLLLAMMVRDSGSNIKKACREWGIPNCSCIGHNFHLITGPLLVKPKGKKGVGDEDDDDVDDMYDDCFSKFYVEHDIMTKIRSIVDEVRKLTSFIKNSSKTIEIIKKLQLRMGEKVLRVQHDVPTRWNSTLHMINRIIKLHDPINEFLSFYKSASGRKEFKGNKTELSDLTDEKWAILKGLSYLLTCFDKATVMLSG